MKSEIGRAIGDHDGAPLLHVEGGTAVLQLNRPAQHNRLDPADVTALSRLFDEMAADPVPSARTPRTLIIRGAGERTFCSGYTLGAIADELDASFEQMLDKLEALPFVTIAVIHGGVYGGATDLALCCDIRLGLPAARMFMPAARFGLHYYPGGMRRYVNNLGLTAAKKLFLTGLTIEAAEMLRIGFLTEIVEAQALEPRIRAYLEAIAQTEPAVVGSMKGHLNRQADGMVDVAAMTALSYRSMKSEELRRRLAARSSG